MCLLPVSAQSEAVQAVNRWRRSPSLEEGDVNRRRVEVDELEDEHFEDEHVFVFTLSPMHLCRKQAERHVTEHTELPVSVTQTSCSFLCCHQTSHTFLLGFNVTFILLITKDVPCL